MRLFLPRHVLMYQGTFQQDTSDSHRVRLLLKMCRLV
jgi:hypothetical protein